MCLNITAGFPQSCLLKSMINESRIGVNKKRHKQEKVMVNSEDKNNVANFKRKWTKNHLINSLLTSFTRSVRESIYLVFFRANEVEMVSWLPFLSLLFADIFFLGHSAHVNTTGWRWRTTSWKGFSIKRYLIQHWASGRPLGFIFLFEWSHLAVSM